MTQQEQKTCNVADCIHAFNQRLLEHDPNLQIASTWQIKDGQMSETVLIPICKIDKKVKGKIPDGIGVAFCPFCGGKTK